MTAASLPPRISRALLCDIPGMRLHGMLRVRRRGA